MIGTNPFLLDVLLISLYAVVFSVLAYTSGVFIFNVQSPNPYRKAFYNLFFGMLMIISLYSCICTGFRTVNVFSLAILAYLSSFNRDFFNYKNLNFSVLLPFLFIFPATIALYSLYILPSSIENDVEYYSKITYSLSDTGHENFYHFYNSYNPDFHGVTAYHYIEFWIASFFSKTTGSLAVLSLKSFSYPYLISLFMYGIIGNADRLKWLFFIVAFLLSLFPVYEYLSFVNIGWLVLTDFWLRPNFIPYYLLFILFYNTMLDKNFRMFYLLIPLSFIFSIILLPVVFSALLLFVCFLWLTRSQSFKQSVYQLLPSVLVIAGMACFYAVFGSKMNLAASGIHLKEILLYNFTIWKAVVFAIVVLISEGSLVLLAMYLFNRFSGKKENNRFLVFVFCLLLSGVLSFQLLNQMDNSYQFAYFAYSGIGFVFIIFVMEILNSVSRPVLKISAVIAVMALCFLLSDYHFSRPGKDATLAGINMKSQDVSPQWQTDVGSYLALHPDAKGCFLFSSALSETLKPKDRICVNRQLGSYICYLTDNCNLPSITCKDSLLYGYNEETKESYAKCLKWLNAFPVFTTQCDPSAYLKSNTFDYYICDISYPVENPELKIITDSVKSIKMVYK